MKSIIVYRKENWKCPFDIFIDNLSDDLVSKITYKINLLLVDLLCINDVKYLREKIFELRVKDKNNIVRVFYFSEINNKIIILDWYIKKDNKLKKEVLNKMIEYKKDYLKRIWNK